jgi:hypothetical protein
VVPSPAAWDPVVFSLTIHAYFEDDARTHPKLVVFPKRANKTPE